MKASIIALLIGFTCLTARAADPVIGFDDLPGSAIPVPANYHGLNYNNLNHFNTQGDTNASGYLAGTVSAYHVVYNDFANPGSISAGLFDLVSADLTAAWNDNLQFVAQGYIKGTLVYSQTSTLSATTPTLVQFNFYGVDQVVFSSSGGTPHAGYAGSGSHFVMDNLTVTTYVPYMAPLVANPGFETGDFTGWGRFGTNADTSVTTNSLYVHSGTHGAALGPVGAYGYLYQYLSPTVIGQTYTLSFWLENFGSGSLTDFNVYWNEGYVLDILNSAPFGWTNIQMNLMATMPSTLLEFGFRNDPSFFGLDDVTVTPTPLVVNGGFETGTFAGWTQSGNTAATGISTAAIYARSGADGTYFGPGTTLGYISQNINTFPGQPYLISCWLDSPDGLTPSQFNAAWGGQTIFNQANLPAFGWTNLHFVEVNSNTVNTLQFGFRDDPSWLGFDEVSVYPVPLVKNGGFEFGTLAGWTQSGNASFLFVTTNSTSIESGFYGGEFGPVGSLGYISQNLTTVPGQAYLISFGLNTPSSDNPSEFNVSWDGQILMDLTNLTASGGFFTYQFAVTATKISTVLQFGFRDDPGYIALDNVVVSPLPVPVITSITAAGTNINLTWTTFPGYGYQPQYKTSLKQVNWTDLGSVLFAPSTLLSVTDTNPPDASRFYRVQLTGPILY